jgi:hypothetical protein
VFVNDNDGVEGGQLECFYFTSQEMLFGFEDSIGRASTVQLQVLRDRTLQGFQLRLERFHIERLRNRRMLPGYNRHLVTKHLYSD